MLRLILITILDEAIVQILSYKMVSTQSQYCTESCIFNCDYANELTCNIMLKCKNSTKKNR